MIPEMFVSALLDLGLLTSVQLDQFLEELPADRRDGRLESLVRGLVDRELLTRFQARRILGGEAQSLVLGNYLLCDKLGQGGAGTVYRARHRRMERVVAVKVLEATETDRDRHYRRFLREVRAAAKLTHPNIVTAHDADEAGGICFLVMEFVDGRDLKTAVDQEGPFTVSKAISCILQAARGLQYAHSHGMVHRDIKPANLLLAQSGVLKILDLGLARITDRDRRTEESGSIDGSSPGRIVGTVDYMSPEQAEDPRAADRRSDVYALGGTLHYLLAAEPPYPRENWLGALMAHRNEAIPDLRRRRAEIPAGIQAIFERMLAKKPADRFGSMADLVAALSPFDDDSGFHVRDEAPAAELDQREETRVLELGDLVGSPLSIGRTSDDRGARHATPGTSEDSADSAENSPSDLTAVPATWIAIGIDLGTTSCSLAQSEDDELPRIVASSTDGKSIPSVLHVDRHRHLSIGREALDALQTDPRHAIPFPLRSLAEDSFPSTIYGSALPPTVLVGLLLRQLLKATVDQVEAADAVVIAVPNRFDESRRGAIQTAGYLAGLTRVDLVNRSTALLSAWEAESRRAGEAPLGAGDHLLAFDLGGGGCDVAVYRYRSDGIDTLALGGDLLLGGLEFDRKLIDHVAESFRRRFGDDPREQLIAQACLASSCEQARRRLSKDSETTVELTHEGQHLSVPLSRSLLRRLTVDLTDRVAAIADDTLRRAGVAWSQLDRVLLAGGGGRMTVIRRLVAGRWGREPIAPAYFEHAVAQGAALHARFLAAKRAGSQTPTRIREVTANALAFVINDRESGSTEARQLIPRNAPLPAFCRRSFRTGRSGQRRLTVTLIEGESHEPEAWIPLGRLSIDDLPADLPAGSGVELTFAYREDGRLAVSYAVDGKIGVPRMERARGLSAVERSVWRGRIEAGTVFDSDEIGLADED